VSGEPQTITFGTLSHRFRNYTHVLLGLKNTSVCGILRREVPRFATLKPICCELVGARRDRIAPPGCKIYVAVF
jgi:hypothetical protein